MIVDGSPVDGSTIPVITDKKEVTVEVTMG